MPFSPSFPEMKSSISIPDDSGVVVHLSDLTNKCSASDESDHLNPDKERVIDITIEDSNLDGGINFDASYSIVDIVRKKYGHVLKWVVRAVLIMLYAIFFVSAIVLSAKKECAKHDIRPLIYLTVAVLVLIFIWFVKSKFSSELNRIVIIPLNRIVKQNWKILRWILSITPAVGVIAIVVMSVVQRPSNLMSLVGWAFFVILLLICSRAPRKVNWRPVMGGFALQFYTAALILKWDKGFKLCNALGEMLTTFLNYSDYGASFVFGKLHDHFFAFKILPVIIFFSCVITMLYYLGVMQAVISKIAFVMRLTLGTTAAESLCAAGNIFVGQTEAPIMIRPFLAIMTRSELHAVMVGGFATIAGAGLAAYVMKGMHKNAEMNQMMES